MTWNAHDLWLYVKDIEMLFIENTVLIETDYNSTLIWLKFNTLEFHWIFVIRHTIKI